MKHKPVSRRTALRGLGTIVALPMLEAMLRSRETIVADGPPRMAFVYAPERQAHGSLDSQEGRKGL